MARSILARGPGIVATGRDSGSEMFETTCGCGSWQRGIGVDGVDDDEEPVAHQGEGGQDAIKEEESMAWLSV